MPSADDLLAAARAALVALHQLDLDGVADDELTEVVTACRALRGSLAGPDPPDAA